MAHTSADRIVVTVLGENRPGIVARVAGILAEGNVDIRDITQSIVDNMFTMTMLADLATSTVDFAQLQTSLTDLGADMGLTISVQREDVFNFMHRL